MVDTFAEARQRDILNLAEELEFDDDTENHNFGGGLLKGMKCLLLVVI